MNYLQETLRAMQEIAKQNPDLSFGDLVQTCFQSLAVENKQSLNFLRAKSSESDKQLATPANRNWDGVAPWDPPNGGGSSP